MFDDLKNNIDFFIRNKTRFSRKNFVEKNPELIERNRLENLYIKDLLEKYFIPLQKEELHVLDIGSKNWFYAKAQHEYFKKLSKKLYLDGIEIDAYRLYSNFFSRYEVAQFYIKNLENTTYIPDNLLNLTKKYDYICWFLPFVIKEPHVHWGLPMSKFYPQKLLNHAYSLLTPNGEMLIINQGEFEANIQAKLLDELKIPYKALGIIKSDFFEYKHKRYGFLIKK